MGNRYKTAWGEMSHQEYEKKYPGGGSFITYGGSGKWDLYQPTTFTQYRSSGPYNGEMSHDEIQVTEWQTSTFDSFTQAVDAADYVPTVCGCSKCSKPPR